ncbi:ABC-type multidrug transport system, ATPase component [Anaerolinea thermolimosa]|uniref:ABC transporter ATP-binding protein n=1 Tax=Anaerolinea thermolimosa TaxID=229919 RepID=UPI000785E95B|nr:ABC transporter ATP-binding protein [Anaerolinea thermolimosa]GAP06432.1 ABC-type multidrug transport system, ATPase component [Anaerolinea thermolimosa]
MYAIQVANLKKNYGSFSALKGISFVVEQGEILSLLGPNGAGKSTTISILCGLIQPTSGEVTILGHSVQNEPMETRAALGVVPQEIALYPDLSARENLNFWAAMYGLRGATRKQRVDETLEIIGLTDRQKDKVSKFSGGMKRRVNLGVALLHRPPVVIMDEPTVGIDPQSRRYILENIKQLNKQGMTVLYTTHYMEEAEELSDHIAIIDNGMLIAYGTHRELIRLVGEQTRIDLTVTLEPEKVIPAWKQVEGISQIDRTDGRISVLATDSNRVLPYLFEATARLGGRITSVDILEPNLEAVFLHLTGKALRD